MNRRESPKVRFIEAHKPLLLQLVAALRETKILLWLMVLQIGSLLDFFLHFICFIMISTFGTIRVRTWECLCVFLKECIISFNCRDPYSKGISSSLIRSPKPLAGNHTTFWLHEMLLVLVVNSVWPYPFLSSGSLLIFSSDYQAELGKIHFCLKIKNLTEFIYLLRTNLCNLVEYTLFFALGYLFWTTRYSFLVRLKMLI